MIRGEKRMLSSAKSSNIELSAKASIHNRFDIEVVDAKTGEIKQRAYAENIILDAYWAWLASSTNSISYIHYGTGTGTPVASRTSLFTFAGFSYADKVAYTNKRGVFSYKQKGIILETAAVGKTITEIGIAYGTAAANLVTHAMLKDMNGNQISIVKTDTDIINLYSTVFVHYTPEGYNGIIMNNYSWFSTNYSDFYGFFLRITHGWQNQQSEFPYYIVFGVSNQQAESGNTSNVTPEFSATNKTLTLTASRIGASGCNTNTQKYVISVGNDNNSQQAFFLQVRDVWPSGFPITGEAIATADGTKKDFVTAFPDISDVKLYANGVEITSGYTIDEGTPFMRTNASPVHHMEMLNRMAVDSDGAIYYNNGGLGSVASYIYLQPASGAMVYENPWYQTVGFKSFYCGNVAVNVSNDGTTWTPITGITAEVPFTVPEAYKHYRYVKMQALSSTQRGEITLDRTSDNNIHFTTAPAIGTVITGDYKTRTIPKDTNHVFDFSCVLYFGEKTT